MGYGHLVVVVVMVSKNQESLIALIPSPDASPPRAPRRDAMPTL